MAFPEHGVRLSFQWRFDYRPDGQGVFSCSHRMIPDFTIEWTDRAGLARLLLLDAKYRVGHTGLTEALGDMHRYRDALVDGEGRRVVAGGFLLCPAPPVEAADRRYLEAEYQERWQFGICTVSPAAGREALRQTIGGYLGLSSSNA